MCWISHFSSSGNPVNVSVRFNAFTLSLIKPVVFTQPKIFYSIGHLSGCYKNAAAIVYSLLILCGTMLLDK